MSHVCAIASDDPKVGRARDFIARTAGSLNALADALDGSFPEAVALLASARRVIVTGVGKSGLIGAKIAASMSSTGTPAHFLHATEAAHGDLGIVGDDDAVIAISNSGDSTELNAIITHCRRFAVPLVGITSVLDSTLGRRSNVVLRLPREAEAGPLPAAPMTSTTMTLVLGDALASALTEEKGFRPEDFHTFHPGGKLGVQTMRLSRLIADSLATHDEKLGGRHPMSLVDVPEDGTVDDVIEALGAGGKGIVGVRGASAGEGSGRIIGSITDGDLRRSLAAIRDGAVTRVSQLMHRDPIHLPDTALVADALATCEEHRIGGVFVTGDDDRVYAVVHIQDLLRAGAA